MKTYSVYTGAVQFEIMADSPEKAVEFFLQDCVLYYKCKLIGPVENTTNRWLISTPAGGNKTIGVRELK